MDLHCWTPSFAPPLSYHAGQRGSDFDTPVKPELLFFLFVCVSMTFIVVPALLNVLTGNCVCLCVWSCKKGWEQVYFPVIIPAVRGRDFRCHSAISKSLPFRSKSFLRGGVEIDEVQLKTVSDRIRANFITSAYGLSIEWLTVISLHNTEWLVQLALLCGILCLAICMSWLNKNKKKKTFYPVALTSEWVGTHSHIREVCHNRTVKPDFIWIHRQYVST